MYEKLKNKWNRIYLAENDVQCPATTVLFENSFLLPEQGLALDLACGLGGNAIYLAESGLQAHAWDISSVALDKLQARAGAAGLSIATRETNIGPKAFAENSFDVIVVSRFLDRSCCNAIMGALKPGGLLFYQTFIVDKVSLVGPSNPQYLLTVNELLVLFNGLRIVIYQENGLLGDTRFGLRNEAQLVAQKV